MEITMKKKVIPIVLLFILTILCGGFLGYYQGMEEANSVVAVSQIVIPENHEMKQVSEQFAPYFKKTAKITAVGDIMLHKWQIERGYEKATDSFDFAESFTYIKPYLSEADYTVGNLELTMAGRNQNHSGTAILGYTDYPCFNAPEVIAKNLKDVGVDLVSTANNHSLDSGIQGVYSTISYLDKAGLEHVGSYKSQEAKQSKIVNINGINFGFCGYTNITNGFQVPSDQSFALNTLNEYNDAKIKAMCNEVRQLKQDGAEVVVPILHFGNEYVKDPDNHQKDVVDQLFLAGADIILGSHPHVLQPFEVRNFVDENGVSKTGVVIYSMGNFISSQRFNSQGEIAKDIGVVLDVTVSKVDNQISIDEIAFTPTYVYWTDDVIGVLPVCEVYHNMEKYKNVLDETGKQRITWAYKNSVKHLIKNLNYETTYENNKYHIILKK